ncbi:checkpoint protein hus1 [Cordyceps javanica]|uniref:Checkpoint protein n=1 Tax=Cordyceps javanica TaxID=43265 RepID=A0A545VM09_9HYPO|nr:checkpoint protein hus1 [Cordyceps javanica]TQW02767.1 checkpoint protein hus1 [Cordyceps javanica]
MRFRTELKNIRTFSKLTAALSSLEKIAWVRLSDETARFTVIPDMGSQVWARWLARSSLSMDLIFENYHIQSAEAGNTINLELPLQPLQRALKSALNSISASLRLTKKDGLPVLSLTITTTTAASSSSSANAAAAGIAGQQAARAAAAAAAAADDPFLTTTAAGDEDELFHAEHLETSLRREHEKIITQDIPVRVLHPETVETIMQPKVREPDVHIQLPPLLQLKAISDRFTKLAQAAVSGGPGPGAAAASASASAASSSARAPKLELSANMHGGLRLRIATDTTDIASVWSGLENPELDPAQLERPLADHPSTRFREDGPDRWATVRVDGRDWSRVLSVGRLEGRVIACFADDHALILYVYVPQYDDASAEDSVVTYYVQSYSA